MASGEMAMEMQPGAAEMHVKIVSPADGSIVTANQVTLQVQTTGYTDSCDGAGKKDEQGFGHYHIELDKALVNMFCTPTATISMQNVKAGKHTFAVLAAQNDHNEVVANATSISFDYEPGAPVADLTPATLSSAKSIKILSPAPGTTLKGGFDITVQISNFNPSCDLLGKPDVSGYGHWHLNVDSDTGAMMGMATMMGMSCVSTAHFTTAGLTPGKHTLIALLTDNNHAPFNPDVAARIDITVA